MKVLVAAYACAPHEGSEPEVGLLTVLAAASAHEVWVLTRADNLKRLSPYLEECGVDSVHLVGVEVGSSHWAVSHRKVLAWLHYERWVRAATARARQLMEEIDFEVLHHSTYASYYAPSPLATLRAPLVWGPVGGGTRVPWRLWGQLGVKGMAREALRILAQRVFRWRGTPIWRARPDARVIVQNAATAKRVGRLDAQVMTNVAGVEVRPQPGPAQPRRQDVVVLGQLVPWKGCRLAIRAFRHVGHRGARLVFIGDGPERHRLERFARRLGVDHRVDFLGYQARREALDRLRGAGVLLHSALRDEASLAVAEALSLGTPVVCLEGGGPAGLLKYWPNGRSVAVPSSNPEATARALAREVDRFLDRPPLVTGDVERPTIDYRSELLKSYELAVSKFLASRPI